MENKNWRPAFSTPEAVVRQRNYLLGKQYPFFMGNYGNLTDKCYLYSVYSPFADDDYNPYISLTKVAEKSDFNTTKKGDDIDLINSILYPKKTDNMVDYLTEMMRREEGKFIEGANGDIPYLQTKSDSNYLVKMFIVNLRNNLRYTSYRLFPGKKVDVLWGPDTFVLCRVAESDTQVWLEPENVYKNNDILMKNPLDIQLTVEDLHVVLDKSQPKIPASLLYNIKVLEKQSFDRRR